MTTTREILTQTAVKQDNGSLGPYTNIGATFDDVIDTDARGNKQGVTLKQFYQHYQKFLNNTDFVYTGSAEPVNEHISLWIDTRIDSAQNDFGQDNPDYIEE